MPRLQRFEPTLGGALESLFRPNISNFGQKLKFERGKLKLGLSESSFGQSQSDFGRPQFNSDQPLCQIDWS
jgi:hypothetical protein